MCISKFSGVGCQFALNYRGLSLLNCLDLFTGEMSLCLMSYGLVISILYCLVLYVYIYIAPLSVHTNQKRFQCERPRKKRAAVLRERKKALGSPVTKVDRVEGGSWFQIAGPMIAKARVMLISPTTSAALAPC